MKIIIFLFTFTYAAYSVAAPTIDDSTALFYTEKVKENTYVSQLVKNKEKWIYILSQIESGNNDWLNVAQSLREHTDASATRGLIYAVSFALKNSPNNVLSILGDKYSVKEVCGSPFIEEDIEYELGFLKALRKKVMYSSYKGNGNQKKTCLKNIDHQIDMFKDF